MPSKKSRSVPKWNDALEQDVQALIKKYGWYNIQYQLWRVRPKKKHGRSRKSSPIDNLLFVDSIMQLHRSYRLADPSISFGQTISRWIALVQKLEDRPRLAARLDISPLTLGAFGEKIRTSGGKILQPDTVRGDYYDAIDRIRKDFHDRPELLDFANTAEAAVKKKSVKK